MIDEASPWLERLLSQPVFLSAVSSLLVAQLIKAIVKLFRKPKVSLAEILVTFVWLTGGMPSSHSSLAVAIATAIGFRAGPDSDIFILALFFALVVMRDAVGVRRSSGVQARRLNQLGRILAKRFSIPYHAVKEVNGHSPAEVGAGAILGFVIALAFCTL